MTEIPADLADSLRKFICDELGYDPSEIEDDTLLFTSGLVDSFTFVGLVAVIENKLGQQLDPRGITVENFDSISRITAFLRESAD
jgi:acyl carrier protein